MASDGQSATGHFTLRLTPDDPPRPEYKSYQLHFENPDGQENPHPAQYHIDVIRDQPPEVQLVEPTQEETAVAENGKLAIKVQAVDPDFALRRVAVRAVQGGRSLPIPPLLERKGAEAPWSGEFLGTCSFEPAKLGLKAGDRIVYWAEAEDNREPEANRSTTDKHTIVVVGAENKPSPQEKPNGDKNEQPSPDEKKDGGKSGEKSAEDKASNENRTEPADKNNEERRRRQSR